MTFHSWSPYDGEVDRISGKEKNWNYYTLLWSKEKSQGLDQLSFGFKFEDIEKYLDKCINYLDVIYGDILNMIKDYKKESSQKEIDKKDNPIQQLDILLKEDKDRLNGRYNCIIEELKTLIGTPITNKSNEKEYQKYRNKLIEKIPYLYDAIQNPEKNDNINEIESIIYCNVEYFSDKSVYCYSKLFEYWNNEYMAETLINHFKDKIKPFNNNISNIRELFCLVKAYNYYKI